MNKWNEMVKRLVDLSMDFGQYFLRNREEETGNGQALELMNCCLISTKYIN